MSSTAARNILFAVTSILIGVLLFAVGFLARVVTEPEAEVAATDVAGAQQASTAAAASDLDFSILGEIIAILKQDFVEPDRIDEELLYEGAIQGLFDALGDPHSTYIDPMIYAISQDDFSGSFQGIGATIARQDNYVVIVRPLTGTPAERAGLEPGDKILAVNGEDAEGWTTSQAVLKIRGPRGTSVDITIGKLNGDEITVTIVRDQVLVASVNATPPGGILLDAAGDEATDIGYVYIQQFTSRTPQELTEIVEEALDAGVRGLIIDVRSNPGGLLIETAQTADMFLDGGLIVIQVDRDGVERTIEARPGTITDIPVVVIQDEFSASGSELLAGALQDNGRATVIGTRSFGKGTVNHTRALSNGGAVYVSIFRWLTPARTLIEGTGIIPDIEIILTADDIEAQRDIALFRAIDVLRSDTSAQAGPVAAVGAPVD